MSSIAPGTVCPGEPTCRAPTPAPPSPLPEALDLALLRLPLPLRLRFPFFSWPAAAPTVAPVLSSSDPLSEPREPGCSCCVGAGDPRFLLIFCLASETSPSSQAAAAAAAETQAARFPIGLLAPRSTSTSQRASGGIWIASTATSTFGASVLRLQLQIMPERLERSFLRLV